MSVLDRSALEQSPLADLHAIAAELSIDGYRLLRREELVEAILARQQRTDGRGAPAEEAAEEAPVAPRDAKRPRRRRARREGETRAAAGEAEEAAAREPEVRQPLAEAAADRARFEALPAAFPDEPLVFESDDPTVAAIESLTPIGKGSRTMIVGPARAGKTEALRRLALALQGRADLEILLLVVGVRPEEIREWEAGPLEPVQALSFAAPASAQDRAVYGVIDEVRSIALRGGDAVVLLDTLDGLHDHAARRALATARKLLDGGSVTLIATAAAPLGGETTVVALDPRRAGAGRWPAVDLASSGTMRAELLVGEQGAESIMRARAEASGLPEPPRRRRR
jgi:transcription termination factor Rho